MENVKNEINAVVNRYIMAIHTQDELSFKSLWSGADIDTLISITNIYCGLEKIYSDFVIGIIQKAYTRIDLIADGDPEIHLLDEATAVVIFQYHTECIKREDGSFFGIKGVETQVMKKIQGEWKLCHIHYSM